MPVQHINAALLAVRMNIKAAACMQEMGKHDLLPLQQQLGRQLRIQEMEKLAKRLVVMTGSLEEERSDPACLILADPHHFIPPDKASPAVGTNAFPGSVTNAQQRSLPLSGATWHHTLEVTNQLINAQQMDSKNNTQLLCSDTMLRSAPPAAQCPPGVTGKPFCCSPSSSPEVLSSSLMKAVLPLAVMRSLPLHAGWSSCHSAALQGEEKVTDLWVPLRSSGSSNETILWHGNVSQSLTK